MRTPLKQAEESPIFLRMALKQRLSRLYASIFIFFLLVVSTESKEKAPKPSDTKVSTSDKATPPPEPIPKVAPKQEPKPNPKLAPNPQTKGTHESLAKTTSKVTVKPTPKDAPKETVKTTPKTSPTPSSKILKQPPQKLPSSDKKNDASDGKSGGTEPSVSTKASDIKSKITSLLNESQKTTSILKETLAKGKPTKPSEGVSINSNNVKVTSPTKETVTTLKSTLASKTVPVSKTNKKLTTAPTKGKVTPLPKDEATTFTTKKTDHEDITTKVIPTLKEIITGSKATAIPKIYPVSSTSSIISSSNPRTKGSRDLKTSPTSTVSLPTSGARTSTSFASTRVTRSTQKAKTSKPTSSSKTGSSASQASTNKVTSSSKTQSTSGKPTATKGIPTEKGTELKSGKTETGSSGKTTTSKPTEPSKATPAKTTTASQSKGSVKGSGKATDESTIKATSSTTTKPFTTKSSDNKANKADSTSVTTTPLPSSTTGYDELTASTTDEEYFITGTPTIPTSAGPSTLSWSSNLDPEGGIQSGEIYDPNGYRYIDMHHKSLGGPVQMLNSISAHTHIQFNSVFHDDYNITGWMFFAEGLMPFYAGIFRPLVYDRTTSTYSFQLVGVTKISPTSIGASEIRLPRSWWIEAHEEDCVGIFYAHTETHSPMYEEYKMGTIPYESDTGVPSPGYLTDWHLYDNLSFDTPDEPYPVGTVLTDNKYTKKTLAIRAVFEPDLKIHSLPEEYSPIQHMSGLIDHGIAIVNLNRVYGGVCDDGSRVTSLEEAWGERACQWANGLDPDFFLMYHYTVDESKMNLIEPLPKPILHNPTCNPMEDQLFAEGCVSSNKKCTTQFTPVLICARRSKLDEIISIITTSLSSKPFPSEKGTSGKGTADETKTSPPLKANDKSPATKVEPAKPVPTPPSKKSNKI